MIEDGGFDVDPGVRSVKRLRRREGQALVEFALVAPLLLIFLYGIIQFGLIFYGYITVQQAAKVGVRTASLGESAQVVGETIDRQLTGIGLDASGLAGTAYVPPGGTQSTTFRLFWEGYVSTAGAVPTVVVNVAYRYPVEIPFFGPQHIEIHQQYIMAQEDPPNGSFASATVSNPCAVYGPSS